MRLWCGLLLSLTHVAFAAASDQPRVTLPKALETNVLHYPDDQTEDADVVLELVIGEDGSVQSVAKVTGPDTFSQVAIADAKAWRFTPATRNGKAIAAKIRYLASYKKPKQVIQAQGARTTAIAPVVEKPAPIEEVQVRGTRNDGQQITLGGAELRQIPGTFGEVFRSIELLPGVTPIVTGLPYFFVRGSPPGNTGYYIDGIRVPQIFHLGGGPGVIQPGLIDSLDFYPSYFPTSFGRATGGVVNANTVAPLLSLHGEWNARLIDAGGFFETNVGKDTSVLAGGRFGYPGLIISLVAPDTRLWYWDYQTRLSHRLNDRDTLTLFVFGSWDQLSARSEEGGDFQDLNSPQFHRVDVKWDRRLERGASLQANATLGFDRTSAAGQSSSSYLTHLRTKWIKPLSKQTTLRTGIDALIERYTTSTKDAQDADYETYFPSRTDTTAAVWADMVIKPHPRVELTPGLRAEIFGSRIDETVNTTSRSATIAALDPRLIARIKLHDRLTLVSTVGMSHQAPSFILPIPGISPANLDGGLQESTFSSIGVEVKLPAQMSLSLTAFKQDVTGLSDATATCVTEDPEDGCFTARTRGRAFGGELMVRRALTEKLTGFLSYTLSRSTRLTRGATNIGGANLFGGFEQVKTGLFAIAGEFDRTHVLNAAVGYDLGRGWRVGTRFVFYTGRPYSVDYAGYKLPPYNGYRMPDFFRFDARLEKRWTTQRGRVSFVVEWMNASLTREAVTMDCDHEPGRFGGISASGKLSPSVVCKPNYFGPVTLPSIGVEGTF